MAIGGRELESFIRRWYELWNAQDKEGWLGHWRSMSPEAPTLEDPVGTPVKHGWELASQLWDATGPDHPTVLIRQLIIGGDEAVVVASNEGTYRGEPLVIPSVDIWHVEPPAPARYAVSGRFPSISPMVDGLHVPGVCDQPLRSRHAATVS